MVSLSYNKLLNAVNDFCDNEELVTADFIVIPPSNVDALTDEEDNVIPNLATDTDIMNMPEICGDVEVQYENIEPVCKKDNIACSWKEFSENMSSHMLNKQSLHITNSDICEESLPNFGNNYSSFDLFLQLFDMDILMMIVKQTNLYARQKNDHSFMLTLAQLKTFVGILILSGYHTLPRQYMYWENAMDSGVEIVKRAMTYKQFKSIKKYIHFNDNSRIDKNDRMFKLRPLIKKLNFNFKKFGIFDKNISIDEQMVPYTGHHSCKMYMKGKPVRFGFKKWVMASSNGYIYSFSVYCGKETTYDKQLGLGASVVQNFVADLKQVSNVRLFFDNFFSSYKLFCVLTQNNIKATGTIRNNRISKCPITPKALMEKEPRGTDEHFINESSNIVCTHWNDTKPVIVMTNCFNPFPLTRVKRYCKVKKSHGMVRQPYNVYMYNKHMGGVDLADNSIACYRIKFRSKKWYWTLFTNMLSMAVINSWRLSNLRNSPKIDLLEHTRNIVANLLTNVKENIPVGRRSHLSKFQKAALCQKPIIISSLKKKESDAPYAGKRQFIIAKIVQPIYT